MVLQIFNENKMIKVGDKIPSVKFQNLSKEGVEHHNTDDLFTGKKVVVFGLPGAFTPTCSAAHLPGYVVKADEFKKKGVDSIVCHSVNDSFVMDAWGKSQNAEQLVMMADGNADFARTLGLDINLTAPGFGVRVKRYAMIVDNGVVSLLNVEEPGKFEVSDAETIFAAL